MNFILSTYKWNRKVSRAKGGKPGKKLLKEYLDTYKNLPIMRLSFTLIKKKVMQQVYEICLLQAIL